MRPKRTFAKGVQSEGFYESRQSSSIDRFRVIQLLFKIIKPAARLIAMQ